MLNYQRVSHTFSGNFYLFFGKNTIAKVCKMNHDETPRAGKGFAKSEICSLCGSARSSVRLSEIAGQVKCHDGPTYWRCCRGACGILRWIKPLVASHVFKDVRITSTIGFQKSSCKNHFGPVCSWCHWHSLTILFWELMKRSWLKVDVEQHRLPSTHQFCGRPQSPIRLRPQHFW